MMLVESDFETRPSTTIVLQMTNAGFRASASLIVIMTRSASCLASKSDSQSAHYTRLKKLLVSMTTFVDFPSFTPSG